VEQRITRGYSVQSTVAKKREQKENEKGKMLKLQSGYDDTFMKLSGTDY